MPVPLPARATKAIMIGTESIEIRSLSRTQVLKLNEFTGIADEEAAEVLLISAGLGISDAEALAWLQEAGPLLADDVLEEIMTLSGVQELRRRQQAKDSAAEADAPKP